MEPLEKALETIKAIELEKRTQAYRELIKGALTTSNQKLYWSTQEIQAKNLEAIAILDEKRFAPLYKEFKTQTKEIADIIGYFQTEQKYFTPKTLTAGGIVGAGVAAGVFIGTGFLPILVAPIVGMGFAPAVKQAYTHIKTKKYLKKYERLAENISALQQCVTSLESYLQDHNVRGEKFIQGYPQIRAQAQGTLNIAKHVCFHYERVCSLQQEYNEPNLELVMKTKLT